MKNAVIIHGKPSRAGYFNTNTPSASNEIWLPWLQQELQHRGLETQTPEMLNAWQPDYLVWKRIFERQLITEETVLVGHSCGGGFLVQWLSEHPEVSVGHIFLVAPSFGDRHTPNDRYEEELLGGFFDFTIDPELTKRSKSINLLCSNNDSIRVDTAVHMIREALPAIHVTEFPGYGHFTLDGDATRVRFPELLDIITPYLN